MQSSTSPFLGTLKLFAAIILTALFGVFLMDGSWGLGFTGLNFLLILFLLASDPQIIKSKLRLSLLAASLLLSVFASLRSYWFNLWVVDMSVLWLDSLAVTVGEGLTLKAIFQAPFLILVKLPQQVTDWIKYLKVSLKIESRDSSKTFDLSTVFIGMVISLPFLLLFGVLFARADPLFAHYLALLTPQIEIKEQLITSLLQLWIAFSLFSAILTDRGTSRGEFGFLLGEGRQRPEFVVATIVLSVFIGLFLLVQVQYLFATDSMLKSWGVMYSDYTRNGYIQLLVVSAISLVPIVVLGKGASSSSSAKAKAVLIVFVAEIILLLISATRRVWLYQENFGLTEARVVGIVFSLWLFGVLILALSRFLGRGQRIRIVPGIFWLSVSAVFLLSIINVDYLVGVVKQPNLGYGTDYRYIAELSSDAWPGWRAVINNLETTSECGYPQSRAVMALQDQLKSLTEQSRNSWHNGGAWVLPDVQALEFLQKNKDRLGKLDNKFYSCFR